MCPNPVHDMHVPRLVTRHLKAVHHATPAAPHPPQSQEVQEEGPNSSELKCPPAGAQLFFLSSFWWAFVDCCCRWVCGGRERPPARGAGSTARQGGYGYGARGPV